MSRGDGPYTHGPSFAMGGGGPRLDWELTEVLAQRVSFYQFTEPTP